MGYISGRVTDISERMRNKTPRSLRPEKSGRHDKTRKSWKCSAQFAMDLVPARRTVQKKQPGQQRLAALAGGPWRPDAYTVIVVRSIRNPQP
jgi:hypothetical protein